VENPRPSGDLNSSMQSRHALRETQQLGSQIFKFPAFLYYLTIDFLPSKNGDIQYCFLFMEAERRWSAFIFAFVVTDMGSKVLNKRD